MQGYGKRRPGCCCLFWNQPCFMQLPSIGMAAICRMHMPSGGSLKDEIFFLFRTPLKDSP